jgi:hypothetical protein
VYAADLSCSDCVALGSETTGNYIGNVTAGTGISITGTPGEGWTPTIGIDTGVVPRKSQAESISETWNFQNGLKVGGGYENNALTIDQYGNILTKGNLTYSGYTYVISTEEVNATANYPFGINVGGSYSGGSGANGQIDIRASGFTSPKARISTDGNDLIINTGLSGASLKINGTVLPYSNNQFNLGSSSYQWANIYGQNVYSGGNPVLTTATSFSGNVTGTYNSLNLAPNSVDSAKIVDNSITSSDVAFNFVGSISAGSGIAVSGGTGKGVTNIISLNYNTDLLGWGNLTAYPASCPSGQFVTGVGDSLSCATPAPASGGGWTDDGTIVRLTTSTDNVTIGADAPAPQKLNVVGNANVTGTIYEGGTALSSKYVPQTRQVSAGAGLTGGGNLGSDVTLSVAFGENFLGWGNLTNYPSSCQCGAGYAVQTIGDTCTCVAITPGGAGVVGSGTVGYIPLWNGTNSINNSIINQTAGNVWITSGNLNILLGALQIGGIAAIDSSRNANFASSITLGGDVVLSRGAADRLDLASGDSLNLASGALQIGGTTVIDSSRNLVGINLVNQNLNVNSNSIINAAWVNATNIYASGTIYGNVQGSITSTGNLNMNNYDIYNAKNVNTTNLFASGNVGIGTTSPSAKLQVVDGAIMPAVGNLASAGIYFPPNPGGGSGDEAFIRYYVESGENTKLLIGINNDADDDISFYQAGAERLTIYNGNVGIGTTTPAYKLDVRANLNSEGSQIEYVASNDNVIASQTSGGTWEVLDNILEGFRFNSGSYTNLAGVALYIKRSTKASLTGWVRVRLYTDNAGVPGTWIATGTTIYANRISTTGSWYYFGLRYGLSANTNYWIIVERSGLEADDIYLDSVTTISNHVYSNDGTTWTSEAKSLRYYVYAYSSRGIYAYTFGSYNADYGQAIYGSSYTSPGVYGYSQSHYGVRGYSLNSWGGYFEGASGVIGYANSGSGTAVQGYTSSATTGYIFYGGQAYNLFTGEGLRLDMSSAGLTKVFYYDGAAFTDRTTTWCQSSGTAYSLLTDADDVTYFGLTSKFTQLQFDIGTAGAGLNLVWEYSAGSGVWNALTLSYDETKNFTRDGIVTWSDPGTSWVTDTVNGVSAYWIRVRTNTVPTTAPTAYVACRSGFTGYFARFYQTGQEKLRVDSQGRLYVANEIYPGTTTEEDGIQTSRYIYDTGSAIGTNSILYVAGSGNNYFAGNVGIGTSSPVKKLNVVGDINATGDVFARGINLTAAAAGGITGSGTTNYIPKFTGAQTIGNSVIYDNGNVGIGTTSPTQKLEVAGNVNASIYYDRENSAYYLNPYGTSVIGAMNMNGILNMNNYNIENVGNLLATGNLISSGYVNASIYYDRDNSAYYLDPASTGNSLLVAGKVGIGVTSPPAKFSIIGGTSAAAGFGINNGDVWTSIYNDPTTNRGVIQVTAGGSSTAIGTLSYDLLLNPYGGKVGIGVTSPQAPLHVQYLPGNQGTIAIFGSEARVKIIDEGTDLPSGIATIGAAYGLGLYAASGPLRFYTGGTGAVNERMRIDTSGNVGIGTTAPARKLHVMGGNITVSNDTVARSDIYWDATNNRLVIQVA